MKIRAKFKLDKLECILTSVPCTDAAGKVGWRTGEVRTLIFSPVYGDSEENRKFWLATPTGSLQLGCANLDAVRGFELGREYYIDVTET